LVDRDLVELGGDICDLQAPCLLQRRAAVGDLLGTLDHGVDGLVVVLLARELPLADHPPDPGSLARAHPPGGLQELHVGEVVAVPFEVPGQVARCHVSSRWDSRSQEAIRVNSRKTNSRHMTGDHHGRTARRATLLVRDADKILGTHR
jgi:hypothetical protein